jgi:hypothetical protein
VAGNLTEGLRSVTFTAGFALTGHSGTQGLLGDNALVYTHGGMAVDIGALNGSALRSDRDPALVARFMNNLMQRPYAAEVYGPAGAQNRPSTIAPWGQADNTGATWQSHWDHIHYSSYGWPFPGVLR